MPGGNLPARPFLGLSSGGESSIHDIVNDYLANAL